jgi:hypothetical protein
MTTNNAFVPHILTELMRERDHGGKSERGTAHAGQGSATTASGQAGRAGRIGIRYGTTDCVHLETSAGLARG